MHTHSCLSDSHGDKVISIMITTIIMRNNNNDNDRNNNNNNDTRNKLRHETG